MKDYKKDLEEALFCLTDEIMESLHASEKTLELLEKYENEIGFEFVKTALNNYYHKLNNE